MSRIIGHKTLCGHLDQIDLSMGGFSTAGARFALSAEQLSDARWRISQQITALECLERSLVGQTMLPKTTRMNLYGAVS